MNRQEISRGCGADFNARTDYDKNFVHVIKQYGNEPEIIELVIYNINSRDEILLEVTIMISDPIFSVKLTDYDANTDIMGDTLRILDCKKERTGFIEKLMEYDSDLKYKDTFGRSLLHLTINSSNMVDLLVKYGVDVNDKDNMGQTPLHLARNCSVVKILFLAGARVDVVNEKGESPLYAAILKQHVSAITELLKSGANIQDFEVFQLVLKQLEDNDIRKFHKFKLKKHLIKLIAAGLLNKSAYKMEPNFKKFFEVYQEEIKILKTFFIDDHTSLYSWLHKNRNRRRAYVNNKKLKNLVEDTEISRQFPNYFVLIVGCYNETIARKTIMEEAVYVLKQITKINWPDLCTDQIILNLSNMDMVHFIAASEKIL